MANTQQQTDLQAAPAEPTTDEMWAEIKAQWPSADILHWSEEGWWGVANRDSWPNLLFDEAEAQSTREDAIRDAYSRLPKPAAVQQESADIMKKWRVTGAVYGSKYLGEFEAETKEEAEEMALNSDAANCCLCHQCSDECESPEIQSAEAEEVTA